MLLMQSRALWPLLSFACPSGIPRNHNMHETRHVHLRTQDNHPGSSSASLKECKRKKTAG